MDKTDKEVLELCKVWFEDITERCDKLTSGNVSHGSRAIHGIAKNYAEYVDEHLHNKWKPTEEQIKVLDKVIRNPYLSTAEYNGLIALKEQLKQLLNYEQ